MREKPDFIKSIENSLFLFHSKQLSGCYDKSFANNTTMRLEVVQLMSSTESNKI